MVTTRRHIKSWVVPKFDHRDASLALYLPLWYPYSDMRGSTIYSYDRNRHAGVVTGGVFGKDGWTVDGDDDINCGTSSVLDHAANPFSVGAWVKRAANGTRHDIGARLDGNNGWDWDIFTTDKSRIILRAGSANVFTSTGTITVSDGWVFLLFTRASGGALTLYKNGDSWDSTTGFTYNVTAATSQIIGNINALDSGFNGTIGEVLIYSRALSAAEILRIYQVTKWRYA